MVRRAGCSQVEAQSGAPGRDLLHFLRLIGHDGAGPAGQQEVCHVVGRHIVGDAVDQRPPLPHPVQAGSQLHIPLSFVRRQQNTAGHPTSRISPRPSSAGHDFPTLALPKSGHRSERTAPSQPVMRAPFSSFFSAVVFLIISSVSRSGKSRNLFFSHRSLQKITVWNKCLILLLLVPVSPRPAPGA